MEKLRQKINEIDAKIVKLFRERMETVNSIAEYKKAHGLDVYDPAREAALLARLSEQAGPDFSDDVRALYGVILDISKKRQRKSIADRQPK